MKNIDYNVSGKNVNNMPGVSNNNTVITNDYYKFCYKNDNNDLAGAFNIYNNNNISNHSGVSNKNDKNNVISDVHKPNNTKSHLVYICDINIKINKDDNRVHNSTKNINSRVYDKAVNNYDNIHTNKSIPFIYYDKKNNIASQNHDIIGIRR